MIEEEQYRPAINYLSFVGQRFLTQGVDIDKEEYVEIAMFLDERAIKTGNLDRFEFKARNFACLVLSLLCERNPFKYIFDKIQIKSVVSK